LTLFDIIALTVLGLSVLTGLARGAMREVTTVAAFVLAAFGSLFALRFTGPLALKSVHPSWAANGVAIVSVFIVLYLALRIIGAGLTRSVRQTQTLGTLDRLIGAGFGVVRGLVLLGIFNLVFTAATPSDRMPGWISRSALYPLAQGAGAMLRAIAPKGFAMAGYLTPKIKQAVGAGAADQPASSEGGQNAEKGYDAAARKGLDDVVERLR
jgi:membrane protein required for colicin V production